MCHDKAHPAHQLGSLATNTTYINIAISRAIGLVKKRLRQEGRKELVFALQQPSVCIAGVHFPIMPAGRASKTAMLRQQEFVDLTALDLGGLESRGIAFVPGVLGRETVMSIRKHIRSHIENKNLKGQQILRPSSGSGRNGHYGYYKPGPGPIGPALGILRRALAVKLGMDLDYVETTRFIILRYGEGGVNWAHQDQTRHTYQALVLLSDPGIDFTGGELYVRDGQNLESAEDYVAFQGAGDLVVFCAHSDGNGRNFFHGMREVQRGEGDVCERWAVGLLQPPASPKSGATERKARKRKKRRDFNAG